MNLFFVVFRSFALLPNSMSKLIDDRIRLCICKLISVNAAAYVYANEQVGLCFYALVCYFCSPLKIILKQLFSSVSLNIVNIHSPLAFGE